MIDTTLPNPATFKHNFVEPLQTFKKQQEIMIKPEIVLKLLGWEELYQSP